MAEAFRCVGWKDLVSRVELQVSASYPDDESDRCALHAELAQQLQARIGDHVPLDTLRAAITRAGLGCSAGRRGEARRFFSHCPAKTVSQWGRLMEVEAAYSYHTRYNQGKTAYDLRMQEYWRQVAVAKILGTPLPRKRRRPKAGGN